MAESKIIPKLMEYQVKGTPYLHLIDQDGKKEKVPEHRFFKDPINRSVTHLRSKGMEVLGFVKKNNSFKIIAK